LAFALRTLVSGAVIVGAVLKSVWEALANLFGTVGELIKGNFSAALTKFGDVGQVVIDNVTGTMTTLGKLWSDGANGLVKTSEDVGKNIPPPLMDGLDKAKNALQSFLDSTSKRTAGLAAEAATIGKTAYETDRLKVALEAEAIAKANNIPLTEQLKQKIDQAATSFAGMAEKANFGRQVFESTRTPLEQYQLQVQELNEAMGRGSINSDTYARGIAQVQQKLAQANPYAQALGSSLESAFNKAIDGGAKFSDILQSLLKDLSKAGANVAFKQLLYGPEGGTSGGLLGSIFSALPKFANGGSFEVGGAGGIDSQLVAFHATPGERVTITNEERQARSSAGGGDTYFIDSRGADVAAVARLERVVADMQRGAPGAMIATSAEARSRRIL
jgi:hypothetical protein